MRYLAPVLLVLGLISAACGDDQRDAASPTQTTSPETASSPSAEEMLIDSQSARIAALKENIEILDEDIKSLESTIEDLESKNQEAAQTIDDRESTIEDLESKNQEAAQQIDDLESTIGALESKNQEAAQQINDLEAENKDWNELFDVRLLDVLEMEEMLNDLRCRTHIDIELVLGGCDWESPDSMPIQIGGWIWSSYDDGDMLSITYAVAGEGADSQPHFSLRLYCIWDVNPQVFVAIDVGEDLHEAREGVVNVDYQTSGTERFELPWTSRAGSGNTTLSPEWSDNRMVLDDLRTSTGTLEVMITVEGRPPLEAVFEIDGITEVYDLLEPGCRGTDVGLRGNAA